MAGIPSWCLAGRLSAPRVQVWVLEKFQSKPYTAIGGSYNVETTCPQLRNTQKLSQTTSTDYLHRLPLVRISKRQGIWSCWPNGDSHPYKLVWTISCFPGSRVHLPVARPLHGLWTSATFLGCLPVAPPKIEGLSSCIVYMGILINTVKGKVRLPEDKLAHLLAELDTWGEKKPATNRSSWGGKNLHQTGALIPHSSVV